MVVPGIRSQVTGFRKRILDIQGIIIAGTSFLMSEPCFLRSALARDLGTHGVIYPIEEIDPIQVIQQKLKVMEDSGELKRRNLEMQKKARASVERPKPVEGMTKAPKGRVFYYDPTYVVKEDLYDHQGRAFAKKGTKINPLETVSLSQNLIFFDGDDAEQLAWAKEQLQKGSVKSCPRVNEFEMTNPRLILISGAPLQLSKKLNVSVYFDQGGVLTKKLGIKHVPAIVSQEKLHLRIEEIKLSPPGKLVVEGNV